MNRKIARGFASILTVIHVAVFCILGLGFVMALASGESATAVPILLAAIAYVLLMGFISTVVSINENLERIASMGSMTYHTD